MLPVIAPKTENITSAEIAARAEQRGGHVGGDPRGAPERVIRETIEGVQAMAIDDTSKKKIFADNARRLFRLPV